MCDNVRLCLSIKDNKPILGFTAKPKAEFLTHPGPKTTRLKLWELPSWCLCSVIGTCLTLKELRYISRKTGFAGATNTSDHELHRTAVSLVSEANATAKKIQKTLDRKYQSDIKASLKADANPEALWDQAITTADVAGPYWALLTNSNYSRTLRDRAYGEIHMLSHLSGASVRIDMGDLQRLRKRVPKLEADHAKEMRDLKKRLKQSEHREQKLQQRLGRTDALEQQLNTTQQQLAALQQQLHDNAHITLLNQQNKALKTQLNAAHQLHERLGDDLEKWLDRSHHAQHQVEYLEEALQEAESEVHALESLTQPTTEAEANAIDLAGKQFLYVGGRSRMMPRMRSYTEHNNGQLSHHDGGLQESASQLASRITQADVVMCAMDCISHEATDRVRRACRNQGKPCVMLRNSSLSSFVNGLSQITH